MGEERLVPDFVNQRKILFLLDLTFDFFSWHVRWSVSATWSRWEFGGW
jgi:hypothetical protein